jgi:endonuclease YncB( thermonuclease family)
MGERAAVRLTEILAEGEMEIGRSGEDRLRRTLAVVRIGGDDVGATLLAEGLARPWRRGRRADWCRFG